MSPVPSYSRLFRCSCAREHSPDRCRNAQRMRECLENDLPIARPVAMPSKRGECDRMHGTIGEPEPTLERKAFVLSVRERRGRIRNETLELGANRRPAASTLMDTSRSNSSEGMLVSDDEEFWLRRDALRE